MQVQYISNILLYTIHCTNIVEVNKKFISILIRCLKNNSMDISIGVHFIEQTY